MTIAGELRHYAQVGSSLDLPSPKRTALAAADLIDSLEEQLESAERQSDAWHTTATERVNETLRLKEQLEAYRQVAANMGDEVETMRELNRRAEERCAEATERLRVAHRYLLEDANGETDESWYYEALRATDITASFPAKERSDG